MVVVSDEELLKRYSRWGVGCVFAFPALGGALFGYDIGATSYVITQLTNAKRSGVGWSGTVDGSSVLQGVITSGGVLGALFGAAVVFRIADQIGRRLEMIYGAYLYIVGAILEFLAGYFRVGLGLTCLLLGRIIYGVGCGFVMHAAPSYIAEMSPPSIRGTLVSLKEASIVVGIAVGYGVGFGLSKTKHGWQFTYGVSAPAALVLWFGATFLLPPSARWLALRGDTKAATESLAFVYTDKNAVRVAAAELRREDDDDDHETTDGGVYDGDDDSEAPPPVSSTRSQQQQEENDEEQPQKQRPPSLWEPRYRRALVAGLGVVLLQQFTGQPSVLYYASSIFEEAGIGAIASVFVGLFKLVATLGAVATVDKRGRRRLLFEGTGVMFVALVGLALAFAVVDTGGHDKGGGGISAGQGLIITLIFLYISGYQFGFGPCAWLLISEIFPLKVRGQAVALAVQANFAANLVVSLLFPVALDVLESSFGTKAALATLFALFAAVDLYSLLFIHTHVPETKGLTLEQIEAYWERHNNTDDKKKKKRPASADDDLDDFGRPDDTPLLAQQQ